MTTPPPPPPPAQPPPPSVGPPPGWYPDPSGDPGRQRYFDGQRWTENYLSTSGVVMPPPDQPGTRGESPTSKTGLRNFGRREWLILGGGLVVVLLVSLLMPSGNKSEDTSASPTRYDKSTSARAAPGTTSARVTPTPRATPTPTSTEPPKPEANFTGDPTGAMTATFDIPPSITAGFTKNAGRYKTIEVLEYSKKAYPGATQVNIVGSHPLIDAYGNTATEVVIDLVYSRSTIDKINFAGVDKDNIWELADSGFVVPAFQK